VSAADAQSYVTDQLEPAESRAGNESAIVAIMCEARYQGRPDFAIPPPLDPVPVLLTAEPTASAIEFALDLTPYLGGTGLTSGDLIRPEHASAAAVFTAYRRRQTGHGEGHRSALRRRTGGVIVGTRDRSAIVAALSGASVRARIASSCSSRAHVPYATVSSSGHAPAIRLGNSESLPRSASDTYRLRRGMLDIYPPAGRWRRWWCAYLDDDRAPSRRAPRRRPPGCPHPGSWTHGHARSGSSGHAEQSGGATSLPRRYPPASARARRTERCRAGRKPLRRRHRSTPGSAPGIRLARGPRARLVWAYSMTRDGVPSTSRPFPRHAAAPLPVPALAAAQVATQVFFAWTWPAGDHAALEVALERSLDGVSWHRFSPLFGATTSSYVSTPPGAGPLQYRVVVVNAAGRKAFGDPITPV
jgi:hypothetical protein